MSGSHLNFKIASVRPKMLYRKVDQEDISEFSDNFSVGIYDDSGIDTRSAVFSATQSESAHSSSRPKSAYATSAWSSRPNRGGGHRDADKENLPPAFNRFERAVDGIPPYEHKHILKPKSNRPKTAGVSRTFTRNEGPSKDAPTEKRISPNHVQSLQKQMNARARPQTAKSYTRTVQEEPHEVVFSPRYPPSSASNNYLQANISVSPTSPSHTNYKTSNTAPSETQFQIYEDTDASPDWTPNDALYTSSEKKWTPQDWSSSISKNAPGRNAPVQNGIVPNAAFQSAIVRSKSSQVYRQHYNRHAYKKPVCDAPAHLRELDRSVDIHIDDDRLSLGWSAASQSHYDRRRPHSASAAGSRSRYTLQKDLTVRPQTGRSRKTGHLKDTNIVDKIYDFRASANNTCWVPLRNGMDTSPWEKASSSVSGRQQAVKKDDGPEEHVDHCAKLPVDPAPPYRDDPYIYETDYDKAQNSTKWRPVRVFRQAKPIPIADMNAQMMLKYPESYKDSAFSKTGANEEKGSDGTKKNRMEKFKNFHVNMQKERERMIEEADLLSNPSSYVSHGPPVYNEKNPPLFDKYHYHTTKIMRNLGTSRPPQDGVRTLDRKFGLQELLDKRGGKIPRMADAHTDYTRNMGFPFDNRSTCSSVDLQNPVVKKKPIRTADLDTLNKSHLAANYPHNYHHMYQVPLPSAAPRVFPKRHVPFPQLFMKKVRIRKPKDFD